MTGSRTVTRRDFAGLTAAAASAIAAPLDGWAATQPPTPSPESRLSTRLIDSQHPAIVALASELTAGATSDSERAVRIHDGVRDRIRFGLAPTFYDMKASEVLQTGVGYCNTKTTLFSALLRAVALPTRVRMVDLSADVLRGLFSPGTDTVDHAITEVYLENAWHPVDSYVVDSELAAAARVKLQREGRAAGYGIHAAGTSRWDGKVPSFIQAVPTAQSASNIIRDWGHFEDIEDFYRRTPGARNRLTPVTGLLIRLGAAGINRNIDSVRSVSPRQSTT
jgi:Transglutaminase-like superfamily